MGIETGARLDRGIYPDSGDALTPCLSDFEKKKKRPFSGPVKRTLGKAVAFPSCCFTKKLSRYSLRHRKCSVRGYIPRCLCQGSNERGTSD